MMVPEWFCWFLLSSELIEVLAHSLYRTGNLEAFRLSEVRSK